MSVISKGKKIYYKDKIDADKLFQNKKEQVILIFKRFLRSKLAVIGSIIVLIFLIFAIFANFLAPYNPYEINPENVFAPLSKTHPLGTDDYGRDTLSRIFFGARISFIVGIVSSSIAAFLGILIGAIAGFYSGWIDNILMRLMDSIFSFPAILLAITLVAVLGPSIVNAMIAIGIIYTPIFARIVRGAVIVNKESDYVEAARAIGQSNMKILFLHIMPNCLSPVIVQATVTFADAIIIEAGLSFVGIGAPPPNASWGKMLNEARGYMENYPTLAIFPGCSISLIVLGFNLLGDGLRDILDPRLMRSRV